MPHTQKTEFGHGRVPSDLYFAERILRGWPILLNLLFFVCVSPMICLTTSTYKPLFCCPEHFFEDFCKNTYLIEPSPMWQYLLTFAPFWKHSTPSPCCLIGENSELTKQQARIIYPISSLTPSRPLTHPTPRPYQPSLPPKTWESS